MEIEDPGPKYNYLTVTDNNRKFQVWKDCRVRIFDAFWASEPLPADDKPNVVLFPSQVPSELWKVLNEEEKLTSVFAENRYLQEKLSTTTFNLKSYLFVAIAFLGPFALAFFLK